MFAINEIHFTRRSRDVTTTRRDHVITTVTTTGEAVKRRKHREIESAARIHLVGHLSFTPSMKPREKLGRIFPNEI